MDLNEIKATGTFGMRSGFNGFYQKDKRGRKIGADISAEEYQQLDDYFTSYVENMYEAVDTLSKAKRIQESLKKDELVKTATLVLKADSGNIRSLAELTWYIDTNEIWDSDENIYGKFTWYLTLPEGEI